MSPTPPVLPYADTAAPPGVAGLQVIAVHDDVRRVIVPAKWPGGTTTSFEVTPFAFRKFEVGWLGSGAVAWPRSAVRAVRVNKAVNQLVLDVAGHGPVELSVAPTLAETEAVMHELIAVMTALLPAPRHLQVADPGDGMPPSRQRSTMVAVGVCLAAAAVAGLPFLGPVSCYLLLAAVLPFGIAYGSQRKDFWT